GYPSLEFMKMIMKLIGDGDNFKGALYRKGTFICEIFITLTNTLTLSRLRFFISALLFYK
ncbi:hypothetical protein CHH95_20160, partial [Bacillus licheniformis]